MSAVEVFVIKTLRQINAQKSVFLGNCCCCAVLKNRLACTLKGISKKCPLSITFYVKKYCNRDLDILGKEEAPLNKGRQSSKVWEQVVLSCGVGWGR